MKHLPITLFLLACTATLIGQSIQPSLISTSANYYKTADDISLHSSFGEIVTETLSNGELHLSQGFQQAYFDLVPTAELSDLAIKITVGPNPCSSTFTINKDTDEELVAHLYSSQGQALRKHLLTSRATTLDWSQLPAATYYLQVYQEETQLFQTTKIIKL